jgi:hypothetical protein
MSEASDHDRRVLLKADVLETTWVAIGYLEGVHHYERLNNQALAKYNLRCAVACIKAAARSWNDLEALDAPLEHREAAE